MKVKIKKINEKAVIPAYSRVGDAGLDIVAINKKSEAVFNDGHITHINIVYYTGISLEIPKGYVGLIFPRSSIADYDMRLTNSVGAIDSNYRGEILIKMRYDNKHGLKGYPVGEKIAQLVIVKIPNIEMEEAEELSETERGDKGYGSSGK